MAAYSSQAGKIVVGTQTAEGTPRADLATAGLGLRLTAGALQGNRDVLVLDPEIGGGRDVTDADLGGIVFSGDYEMYARMKTVAFFLANCLGTKVSSVATPSAPANTSYTHTIKPTDGTLPVFTAYEEISNNLERLLYSDAVVNTFHLECDANGFLTCSAGVIARYGAPTATAVDPSAVMDNGYTTVGTKVTVTYDGVKVPARSFSLDINNNVEDDAFELGSFFVTDLTGKRREITLSVNVRHKDKGLMRQALYGTSTATAVGGRTTKKPLVIEMASGNDIPGATGYPYSLKLTFPQVMFTPFSYNPSGDDVIENDIDMQALRPDSTVSSVTAVVTNEASAIV